MREAARPKAFSFSSRLGGRWLLVPVAVLLAACASVPLGPWPGGGPGTTTTVSSAEESALRALVSQQDRLYRVAGPLLVNNPDLCPNHARNLLGFTAKNRYSYSADFVGAAEKAFGMGERLKIMGVLAGSGAARAGLRRGDELVAIEDQQLPQGQNAERQASSILAPLVAGRTSVKLAILRDGTPMTLNVPLTYACAFGIELGNTDNVLAYNDGHRVLITRGMLNATRSDDELAYVMAKEMAHNALGHAGRMRMSATVGGIIDNLVLIRPDMSTMVGMAGVKPMPADLDIAADRLSLYMLARAGYNIDGAPAFWQRMATQYPPTILTAYTALHPSTAQRIQAMEATIKELRTRRTERKPLLP